MAKGAAPKGWQFKGTLLGVAAAVQALRAFPAAVQKRWIKKATTKGGQIVTKAAKALAPTQSKQYKKSLGYKVFVGRRTGKVIAFIGPRLGFRTTYKGRPRDPRYYAHILERGRKAIAIKNKRVLAGTPAGRKGKGNVQFFGKAVAAAAGRYPLRRAWRQTRASVETTMIGVIAGGVVTEARTAAAKAFGRAAK